MDEHRTRDDDGPGKADATKSSAGPSVLTALVCDQCGAVNLIRVKGCWYCERCHYKFDCYGW